MRKQTKKLLSSFMTASMILSSLAFVPSFAKTPDVSAESVSTNYYISKNVYWKVNVEGLPVHKNPTEVSPVLAKIKGCPVLKVNRIVSDKKDYWGEISCGKFNGWICLRYCTPVNSGIWI